MLGSSRNFRLGLTSLLLTAFGTAMLTGTTSPASAAQTSPSYSPTGVCVNGTPELEFSVLGLPSGQVNTVGLESSLARWPRETANYTSMAARSMHCGSYLVPGPATFARFVSSQSAGAGARSVVICTNWANPWP